MPFDDASFDLIISNNGLNNFQNLQKSLLECGRVAKKEHSLFSPTTQIKHSMNFIHSSNKLFKHIRLKTCLKKLDEHIYSKRKPLAEYIEQL